jgi:sugar phosphate isomerase/epimerase
MKLSCIPVSYFRKLIDGEMSILDWIREAVEFGLDGIDLSILFFPDWDAKRLSALRERMHHVGLRLAILNTYSDLTHPDTARRAEEIEQLKRDIETASLLGAENVRVVSGQAHPETGIEHGIQWALEGRLLRLPRSTGSSWSMRTTRNLATGTIPISHSHPMCS